MRTLCGPSGDREDDKVTFAEGAAQRLGVGVLDIRRMMVRPEQFPPVVRDGWRVADPRLVRSRDMRDGYLALSGRDCWADATEMI